MWEGGITQTHVHFAGQSVNRKLL